MEYRILIVAEDARQRRRIAEALIAAPPATGVAYKITATGSPAAAQLQATRQSFHLLLATAGEGSENLALAARLHDLDPRIGLLLMRTGTIGAESLDLLRGMGARLLDDSVGDMLLCQAVAEQLGLLQPAPQAAASAAPDDTRPPATLADVQLLLDVARRQARAQLALYTDNIGNVIAQCGDPAGLELPSLTSLIAGGFVNSIEMGRLLRDPETIHLSVHEGRHVDVYSTNVGSQRLIALLFEKQVAQPRLGMVWLLMKRAAEQLRRMNVVEKGVDEMLSEELNASLNSEFDRLFGSELEQAA